MAMDAEPQPSGTELFKAGVGGAGVAQCWALKGWSRSRSRPVLSSLSLESEEPEEPESPMQSELLKAGVGAGVAQYWLD